MAYKKRILCRDSNCDRQNLSHKNPVHHSTAAGSLNQRGFVTTLALTVLPFIVISALCVLGSVWFVEQKEHVQWLCERQNTTAQKALAEGMNRLLALNPKIDALVIEKKWVQQMMKIPSSPAEKSALMFQLITINLKLTSLMAQQKVIIASAHARAGAEIATLKQKLSAHIAKMGRQWRTSLNLSFYSSRAEIRLRRKKIDALGFLYIEHPLLSEQQKINVKIAITGERLFPKWLQWISPTSPLRWLETCSAQPQKETTQWAAKLHLDKF